MNNHGSLGRVKLGIHKVSGEKVAIKIISKSHLKANASVERAVKREIAVMKLIHHPNIMTLLDVIDLSDSPNLYGKSNSPKEFPRATAQN